MPLSARQRWYRRRYFGGRLARGQCFNPAKTVEQTKKLVEQEEVLLLFGSLGTVSVETVLKPVELDKAAGFISSTFVKDPSDPQWRDNAAMREWLAWMRRYYPDGNAADVQNVFGYSLAQTLVQVLRQCSGDLTRENVLRQATNLKNLRLPMLLPGIEINTAPDDYLPIEQVQLMRFDGATWVRFGDAPGASIAVSRER
jgi:Periplasmic binding protein